MLKSLGPPSGCPDNAGGRGFAFGPRLPVSCASLLFGIGCARGQFQLRDSSDRRKRFAAKTEGAERMQIFKSAEFGSGVAVEGACAFAGHSAAVLLSGDADA